MMHTLNLLILVASTCLFGQILAQSNYTSIVAPFDSRHNASSPYNPALNYDFPVKQAVYYQLIFNVTDATFVDLSNLAVVYTNVPVDIVMPQGSFNATYKEKGNNAEVFGQVIDPCVFATPGATATLSVNATTDAVSGEITSVLGSFELLSLQNATAFEYTSPAPIQPTGNVQNNFQSSRFYFLNLQTNGNENFGLEATSTADISLSIAGLGNCPTYQFSNESPYWSGSVSANQTVTTSVVGNNQTSFVWVLVEGANPASVTLTWIYLGSSPVASTPEDSPVQAPGQTPSQGPAQGPAQGPSGDTKDLPTWATALLVVFGLLIAVLLVVVIVVCVKNRRRSTYQGV